MASETRGEGGAAGGGPEDLAPLYVRILELLDAGADHATIAGDLDLDLEAVPGLVELATAKRARRGRSR